MPETSVVAQTAVADGIGERGMKEIIWMETVVFEQGPNFTRRVFLEYPKGELRVLCPCGEEMIVVLTKEDAMRLKRGRGMYCPKGHITAIFNIR